MRFATKVFVATFGVTATCCAIVCGAGYRALYALESKAYSARYTDALGTITGAFEQVEKAVELAGKNALLAYAEREARIGLPSSIDLIKWAQDFNVTALFAFNRQGQIIRSSQWPEDKKEIKLFELCSEYEEDLFGQHASQVVTPFKPSQHNIPQKFIMAQNLSGTRVLEVSISARFIGKILLDAVKSDEHIESIGVYSPGGGLLSHVKREDVAEDTLETPEASISHSSMTFERKAQSASVHCCECAIADTAQVDSGYFYSLKLTASKEPLANALLRLQRGASVLFGLALCIGLILSRIMARRLVAKIERISAAAKQVVTTGDLGLRAPDHEDPDEVGDLARAINDMVHSLRGAHEQQLEAERERIVATAATQVAHDIKAPLGRLRICIARVKSMPPSDRRAVQQAIGEANGIADNLLNVFNIAYEKVEAAAQPIWPLLHSLVGAKRIEHSNGSIQLGLLAPSECRTACAEVIVVNLQRALSNLVDNGVEACGNTGRVDVTLRRTGSGLEICVMDTGCGLALGAELPGRRGQTTKRFGHGLGVAGANHHLSEMGAKCQFRDGEDGYTTEVIVALREVPAPQHYCFQLPAASFQEIVIVGPDEWVDEWAHSLTLQLRARASDVRKISDLDALSAYLQRTDNRPSRLLLVDDAIITDKEGHDLWPQMAKHQYIIVGNRYQQERRFLLDARGQPQVMSPCYLAEEFCMPTAQPSQSSRESTDPERVQAAAATSSSMKAAPTGSS